VRPLSEVALRLCRLAWASGRPSKDRSGHQFFDSLPAYLHTTLRLPIRLIKEYLYTIHGLTISTGEIVELLHRLIQAEPVKQAALAIKERVRAAPIVHGDETTWREEGQSSATRMTLASLFGTWRAKGLNPFFQCLVLLSQSSQPPLLP
jgi:hypothetical protein